MRRFLAVLSVAFAMSAALSCGDDGSDRDDSAITVFAAASLTDAFAAVAHAFEEANPDVSVGFNFAGSSTLREQILEGAPADVFASANEPNMDHLVDAGEIARSAIFATNRLQIVVPAGNPSGVGGLDDFADSELLIGLCAEEVPCGALGRRALEAAGVVPSPDTDEPDVRALLTKVEAGELDAGLVYVTDVVAAGEGVEGIDVPAELDVMAQYPIGAVTATANPDVATAFVDFVLADEGQAILQEHGFGQP